MGGHKSITGTSYETIVPPPIRWWLICSYQIHPGEANNFAPRTFDFSYCFWLQALLSPTLYFAYFQSITPVKAIGFDLKCTDDPPGFYGNIRLKMTKTGTSIELVNDTSLLDGLPHLIACTCDRDNIMGLKLYVDGVLKNTGDPTPFAGDDFIQTNPLGTFLACLKEDAYLDQFRFYKNIILTPKQITAIYNAGKGVKVNESSFAALTNNGFYAELDEGTGRPTGRLLTNGVWSNSQFTGDVPTWTAGGVPF